MVSADNLNLDVLELIFAYLAGRDLPSVALVSRSFLSGVIPRLYCSLLFRLSQAKRYPTIMTPFSSILSHPDLAVHVRHVDIQFIPKLKTNPHPEFLRDCICAIALCKNIASFTYSGSHLPPLLLSLQNKPRLQDLRVFATLSSDQANKLAEIAGLQSLTLQYASWTVVDILPKWISSLQPTLKDLTIYVAADLDDSVLEAILVQLPRLRGLHIIGCCKIDHVSVLRLVEHTPLLESLSLTIWETSQPMIIPSLSLRHLHHLAFDTRFTAIPSPAPSILSDILSQIQSSFPPLSSFVIKLSERSIQIGVAFIQELLTHASTLKRLSFINCALSTDSITDICKDCINLERLELSVPVKGIIPFVVALSNSTTLHTLVDKDDSHVAHGPRPTLTQDNVRYMMTTVRSLRTIVSDNRIWTGSMMNHDLDVSLERRKPDAVERWFMPRD